MKQTIYFFIVLAVPSFFSCNDEPDITIINDLTEERVSLDSAVSVMVGTHDVAIKITVINSGLNQNTDETYVYDLEIEHILGNKLLLTNTYTDLGQATVSHEVEVSIVKIVDGLVLLKVDPIWNFLVPNDRTYEAHGTGSYVYDNEVYDGVFDLRDNSIELKFIGTTPNSSKAYIISSVRVPAT